MNRSENSLRSRLMIAREWMSPLSLSLLFRIVKSAQLHRRSELRKIRFSSRSRQIPGENSLARRTQTCSKMRDAIEILRQLTKKNSSASQNKWKIRNLKNLKLKFFQAEWWEKRADLKSCCGASTIKERKNSISRHFTFELIGITSFDYNWFKFNE